MTKNPTDLVGVSLYFEIIIVSSSKYTNAPLVNITPEAIENATPLPVAAVAATWSVAVLAVP